MLEQGEIVLIPVPFADLTSHKRRPVIIVSNNEYNRARNDVVVVAMTSTPDISRYAFQLSSSDLVAGQLNRPGTVRVDKIYTLAQSITSKRFGRVSTPVIASIRDTLDVLTTQAS